MNRNMLYILIAIMVLILASLACGLFTTEQLQEAVVPTATTEKVVGTPTEEIITEATEEEQPVDEPATEIPPTNTPLPTDPPPTPTPEPEPITVINFGFGQEDQSAGYAFLVENPNQGLAFEDSQYQVAVYDENGIVIDTDSGYIDLLLPGQTLGIGGDLYFDEGITIANIEVQLNAGDAVASEPVPTFAVENTAYLGSDWSTYVTGKISNPYDIDLSSVKVSAVIYDEAGNIIGGGYSYMSFLLANSSAGAEVSVTSAGEVARVELYPTLSGFSLLLMDNDELPEGAENIVLLDYGFGQDESSIGVGMLIENPNSNFSLESSEYYVTAYAADGTVVDTGEGYISLLLPDQILGVGSDLYLIVDTEVDHVEVQVMVGEFVEADPIPFFTYENVVYQPGSYSSEVTGIVVSPYTSDITDLRVSAITFDENGTIIGGGYTYLDFAPANAKAAVEVSVTVAGTPTKAEIYATVTSSSDFGE